MKSMIVKSKRCNLKRLTNLHPEAFVVDVTSKGPAPWVKFSPFYPHGDIPIPFSEPDTAFSVEGIWQGLKVFRDHGVDRTKFYISSMKNIKRTIRKNGPILGHQKGLFSKEILSYQDARLQIYLPSYTWVIENCLAGQIEVLKQILSEKDILFLDYQTNENIHDLRKPLSHAAIIKNYLERFRE